MKAGEVEAAVARRVLTALALAGALLVPQAARAGTVVKPTLQIIAEERYDDDALFRDAATHPLGAELMTKLTPRGGVHLLHRRLEVDAWYAPDLQARHLSGTFRVDHRAGLDVKQRLGALTTLTLEGRVWRVADPTSLPREGVARTLSPALYGTGVVALEHRITRRLTSNTHYRFEGTRIYEEQTPAGQVHQPSEELWYRLTPRASMGVEYRFQYFLFGEDTAIAHSPGAMFRYRLSRFSTFEGRGGAVWFNDLRREQKGVAPRVLLQVGREVEGFAFGVQAGQDVLGGTGFAQAVFAQFVGGYVAIRVSEPLRLFGNAYGFRNGLAPGTPEQWLGASAPQMAQGYAVGGGVEWRFNPKLMLQVQLDRIAQVGVIGPDGNLSRNIAAVRLVVTPW